MQPLYVLLKAAFSAGNNCFYASTDVRGLENVPAEGEPTLLCFNHGNSLADSIVLIAHTPRTVRFCAKNTLWDIPVVSHMIRMSGAVPVFRRREHGDRAAEFNVETFRAVYEALEHGTCVGFAPEGVSSFRSFATKFKSGVAHIALEAVDRACKRGDKDFKVKILPAVMAWTHREKFRSDALLRFRPPVVVDKSHLTRFPTRKENADALIAEVEAEFHENIISAPDWKTIQYAITATRIHRPLGTYMALSSYMYLLRGWTEVLKMDKDTVVISRDAAAASNADGVKQTTVGQLWEALETYQRLLDTARVRDERVRRIERNHGVRSSRATCVRIIAYRVTICLLLFVLAIPGLVLWSPVWTIIKWKERELLSRGIGWVDSIAENKMMLGFWSMVLVAIVANKYAPLVFLWLWFTMRVYEEAIASARSICGIYRLMNLTDEQVAVMLRARAKARKEVLAAVSMFPATSAARLLDECGDDVSKDRSEQDVERPRWWTNFNPLRRRKKDWNELLRLSDFCTMDYVN